MTRARNISNPQAITLPLTVSANITTNAAIVVGNSTINTTAIAIGNVSINTISYSVGNSTVNTSIHATAISTNGTLSVGNTTITGNLTVTGNTTLTGAQFVNGAVTFANSTANVVYAAANGFVGIGTTAPVRKLDINNGSINFTDGYGIQWGGANSGTYISGEQALKQFWFTTDGTERLRAVANGNIGVACTSPTYAIDVNNGNSIIRAKGINRFSQGPSGNINGYPLSPYNYGYLGDLQSDGVSALYYIGSNYTTGGTATNNFVTLYNSGHWGEYSKGIIYCFTYYYDFGFAKWYVSGTTATLIAGYGTYGSLSATSTIVGSGTHNGQSVTRYVWNLSTNGAYWGHHWYYGHIGGGMRGHFDNQYSEASMDTYLSTRGGGVHFKSCNWNAIKESPYATTQT